MNFHKDDIDRLLSLRRELPKKILKNNITNSPKEKTKDKAQAKKITKEKTPEDLFRELIQISPDGNIPKHLILELKEAEDKNLKEEIKSTVNHSKGNTSYKQNQSRRKSSKDQTLYSLFERLLLEEEL